MADDLKVAAQFAAVVEGRLVQVPSDDDSGYTVVTLTTHRDVANNVKRKCVSRRVVTPTSVTVVQPPTEVVASYIERRSPSGKWNAIVREVKGVAPADTKEWLQVYETDTMTLVHSLDLTTHGDIYFDGTVQTNVLVIDGMVDILRQTSLQVLRGRRTRHALRSSSSPRSSRSSRPAS